MSDLIQRRRLYREIADRLILSGEILKIRATVDLRARFPDLVRANATASVRDEPRCRRVNVLVSEPLGSIRLYELCDSAATSAAHLASPHFAALRHAVEDMTDPADIRRLTLHEHVKPLG